MPIKSHKIFSILLYNILYSISIIKDDFEDLIFQQKLILLIIDISINLFWISLDIYKYNFDSDAMLLPILKSISSSKETSLPST